MNFVLYHNNTILGIFSSTDLLEETIKTLLSNNFVTINNLSILKYRENCISPPSQENRFLLMNNNINIQNNNKNEEVNRFKVKAEDILEEELIEEFSSSATTDNSSLNTEEKIQINKLENEINNIKEEKVINVEIEKKEKENEEKKKKNQEKKSKLDYNLNILKKKKEKLEEEKRMFEIDLNLYQKFKKIKESNENFIIPDMFEKKYNIFEIMENQNIINLETFNKLYKKDIVNTKWDKIFSGDGKERELLDITESE